MFDVNLKTLLLIAELHGYRLLMGNDEISVQRGGKCYPWMSNAEALHCSLTKAVLSLLRIERQQNV